jgi:hypothetical protein
MRTPRDTAGNRPAPRPLDHRSESPALGSICVGEVMPSREFCRRLGLGRKAWTALVRRGFPFIPCGKQNLVDSDAAIAYLRRLAEEGQAE